MTDLTAAMLEPQNFPSFDQYFGEIKTFAGNLFSGGFVQWSAGIGSSFALVAAAEIGDKSQLVCMTLAARHRAAPVLAGAICAFALLNTLAVIFGAAIASWFPGYIVAATVALLFTIFGIQAILTSEDSNLNAEQPSSLQNIFLTALLLITFAEFADKTQLAVVALSSAELPAAVWLGATLALAGTSAIGVLAGRTILQKIPLTLLHRLSGLIFLSLAGFAGYKAYINLPAYFWRW